MHREKNPFDLFDLKPLDLKLMSQTKIQSL